MEVEQQVKTNNRFLELDALRGIAALLVVFFHFTMRRPEADLGFKYGTTGVDLFFMISGFVIFMSINKVSKSSDFIINRLSRLYPTYWACVTFTFLLILLRILMAKHSLEMVPFGQYLGNLTMFQSYLRIKNLDGPYWTMTTEMLFYILILVLYHFKILKHLNLIFIALILSAFIGFHFLYDFEITQQIKSFIPLLEFLPLFFSGILFYKIYHSSGNHIRYYATLLGCLITQISFFNYAGRSFNYIDTFEYAVVLSIYFIVFTLLINNKLKMIVTKPTLFLGKISFSLYLIHQYISRSVLIPILTKKLHINFWVAAVFITLPIIIAVAGIITYYIEIPFSRKMKLYLHKKIDG